jgi:hypothetical protein
MLDAFRARGARSVTSRWRVGFALLIGLGSMSILGVARADVERPQRATVTPRVERWSSLEIGVRTGYGIPIGRFTRDEVTDVSDIISGQVPIHVDVGARINGHFIFGIYYSYGFGIVGSSLREACDFFETSMAGAFDDVSCYVRSHRVGLQLGYHIMPRDDFDPWIAAAIGHEFLDSTLSTVSRSGSATSTIDADGMELLNFQTGLDYRVSERLRAGPFFGVTVTTYGDFTRSCHGACGIPGSSGGDVRNGASHAWLFFGLRGVVLP